MIKFKVVIKLVAILFITTSCIDSGNMINDEDINISEIKNIDEIKNLEPILEYVNNYNHPIFDEFKNNHTVELNSNTKYIFSIPILLNGYNNLTINGNGATLCFPFNGEAISIDNCNHINIINLTIDNVDEAGNKYLSAIEAGRIDMRNSSFVVLNSLIMNEQLKPAINPPNYIQINIYNSTSCEVLNSVVYYSSGELIVVDGSNDCVIKGNRTFKGDSGIATKGRIISYYRGYRTIIKDNEVYNCIAASITVNDRESLVEDNFITSDEGTIGGPGIRFGHANNEARNAKNCIARGNIITNFKQAHPHSSSSAVGIKIDASVDMNGYGNITIENNEIRNCKEGITVSNAPGQSGVIKNNIIETDGLGISIFSPDEQILANFEIFQNTITSEGSNYDVNHEYAVRFFNSSINFHNNAINLLTSYKYARAVDISHNVKSARVNIIDNNITVNNNYGIQHTSAHMYGSNITGNVINNPGVGMLLKCENSLIFKNTINNSSIYGIYLFDGAKNSKVEQNTISVSYSAGIRMHNTDKILIVENRLTLLAGSSLYAVYKTAWNGTPTFEDNFHNYPHLHN